MKGIRKKIKRQELINRILSLITGAILIWMAIQVWSERIVLDKKVQSLIIVACAALLTFIQISGAFISRLIRTNEIYLKEILKTYEGNEKIKEVKYESTR